MLHRKISFSSLGLSMLCSLAFLMPLIATEHDDDKKENNRKILVLDDNESYYRFVTASDLVPKDKKYILGSFQTIYCLYDFLNKKYTLYNKVRGDKFVYQKTYGISEQELKKKSYLPHNKCIPCNRPITPGDWRFVFNLFQLCNNCVSYMVGEQDIPMFGNRLSHMYVANYWAMKFDMYISKDVISLITTYSHHIPSKKIIPHYYYIWNKSIFSIAKYPRRDSLVSVVPNKRRIANELRRKRHLGKDSQLDNESIYSSDKEEQQDTLRPITILSILSSLAVGKCIKKANYN